MNSWIFLVVAGLLEVGWAVSMKQSDGFTKLAPTVITVALMITSFALLALALKQLPVSTAYAVWTGIGAVGTAIVGMAVLREPVTVPKVFCVSLIAVGIVGLKLFSK